MTLEAFQQLTEVEIRKALVRCCGASKWCDLMYNTLPLAAEQQLHESALQIWYDACDPVDWKEAFEHHPKIGDLKSLEKKFASTASLAGAEQASVQKATSETLEALAEANAEYASKFGYIFIVCATGKSADEMLSMIRRRIPNSVDHEIHVAMNEQAKITALRLAKLLNHQVSDIMGRSQVTSHILDTSRGRPASGVTIALHALQSGNWQSIAQGITNHDGRVEDLIPSGRTLESGIYKLVFDTKGYWDSQSIDGFYPSVEIQFVIQDNSHYHVPLLLNPFGYSTYRGS